MEKKRLMLILFVLFLSSKIAAAAPTVGWTRVIGPFTGVQAKLHPANVSPHRIRYYGTDLGWTYEYKGKIQILFGDTNATEGISYIEASSGDKYDDGFGSIDFAKWHDPAKITPHNIPLIKLGQIPGSSEMAAIHPGDHPMEGFKTPVGGFSNGDREFGVFYTSKQQSCIADADCENGLSCDNGIGFTGQRTDNEAGHTYPCIDGDKGCNADTIIDSSGTPVADSGMCVDKTSSNWAHSDIGRISAVGLKQLIGIRSTRDPRIYSRNKVWLTTKFANPAIRTVQRFMPATATDRDAQNYHPATGHSRGQRVFLWGRPGFIGVAADGRPLALYFAWVDMPAGKEFTWQPHYYTGMDANGNPQFSLDEKDAVPLDLDSTRPGVQSGEQYDVVDQMSVAWVQKLHKWVMFYGGGMSTLPNKMVPHCGVLEFFAGSECKDVVIGNGAIRMRTADNPWGPWSPPQDVFIGGDPAAVPLEHQYAEGGILRHPDCKGPDCAPHTGGNQAQEYGFLYGANIIAQWIKPAGRGVNVIWNVSTWDPYRIVLMRTHINP